MNFRPKRKRRREGGNAERWGLRQRLISWGENLWLPIRCFFSFQSRIWRTCLAKKLTPRFIGEGREGGEGSGGKLLRRRIVECEKFWQRLTQTRFGFGRAHSFGQKPAANVKQKRASQKDSRLEISQCGLWGRRKDLLSDPPLFCQERTKQRTRP